MKNQLSIIQIKLIESLLSTNEPVSSQFLANSLGCSSKTVRNNLNELNLHLEKNGAKIYSKTGTGYWITVTDQKKFNQLSHPELSVIPRQIINPVAVDRSNLIVRHLLCSKSYVKVEELENLLFMNRTSVKQSLARAKRFLQQFDLKIVSKNRYGLKIIGNEHDIRLCLNYEYGNFKTTSMRLFEQEEYEKIYQFDKLILDKIEAIICEYQKTYISYNLSSYSVSYLARLIMISSIRNKQGNDLKYPESTIIQYTNRNSYYVSKMILGQCAELLDVQFTREDVILLAIGFVSFRIALSSDEMYRDGFLESKDIAFELLHYLGIKNQFSSINKDIKLADDIALHLDGLFTRSKFHFKTSQFITDAPVSVSLMSRKLALQCLVYLNQKYGIWIQEEEVIRLAMIIHPVFGRYPSRFKTAKACVVSKVDKSVAQGTAERLMRNFSRFIEQIDVVEFYELKEKDLSGYSFLFTDYSENQLNFIPEWIRVFHVDLFLNEATKEKIRYNLVNDMSEKEFCFAFFLKKSNVFYGVDCSSKEECIQIMSELIQDQFDQPDFLKIDLELCEKLIQSHPKDNVVILSGLENHTKSINISIFVLKRPIQWGKSTCKAQVIIYWDRGSLKEDALQFETEFIPHILENVFYNRQVIDVLLKESNYEKIIEAMKKARSLVLMMSQGIK